MKAADWGDVGLEELGLEVPGFEEIETIEPPELKDGDRPPIRQMTFTVHDDQHETIAAAIAKAKKMGGAVSAVNENSNGNALAYICGVFNGKG